MGTPVGKGPTNKSPAMKKDLPYIKCQVCETIVKQALKIYKGSKESETPASRLQEGDVLEKLEKMCNPEVEAGEWITHYDLKEEGDELKLVDMGQPGKCEAECWTIAWACEEFIDNLDLSEFSEQLWKGKRRSALSQWACRDNSRACRRKAPALPKDRTPGPEFVPLKPEEAERKKVMRNMKEAGLKGTLYDRDSIVKNMDEWMDDLDEKEGKEPKWRNKNKKKPVAGDEL